MRWDGVKIDFVRPCSRIKKIEAFEAIRRPLRSKNTENQCTMAKAKKEKTYSNGRWVRPYRVRIELAIDADSAGKEGPRNKEKSAGLRGWRRLGRVRIKGEGRKIIPLQAIDSREISTLQMANSPVCLAYTGGPNNYS
jgi:hypothetical protein